MINAVTARNFLRMVELFCLSSVVFVFTAVAQPIQGETLKLAPAGHVPTAPTPDAATIAKLQRLGILPALPTPPPLPEGFIAWSRFAKQDPELKKLAGTKVKIAGFMFPLDQAEKHKHFLLSVNPPSCPFCMPAGPEGLIEVFTNDALTFDYNMIKIEGALEFPENDPMGLLYRVKDGKALP